MDEKRDSGIMFILFLIKRERWWFNGCIWLNRLDMTHRSRKKVDGDDANYPKHPPAHFWIKYTKKYVAWNIPHNHDLWGLYLKSGVSLYTFAVYIYIYVFF